MTQEVAAYAAGYSVDLAAASGQIWAAWCTCETDELSLFARVQRNWPLRPGVTPEDRRAFPRARFRLYLAPTGGQDGPTPPTLLTGSEAYLQGPIVAASQQGQPWVVWGEHHNDGYALYAWHENQRVRIVTSCWPMLQPAATVSQDGALWVAWQARASDVEATPAIFACTMPSGASTARPVVRLSAAGNAAWSPALAPALDGGVWCAWDTYQQGSYTIMLGRALGNSLSDTPAQEAWTQAQPISGSNVFDLSPSIAVDAAGHPWVAWSRADRWG